MGLELPLTKDMGSFPVRKNLSQTVDMGFQPLEAIWTIELKFGMS